jgi:thiaminase/transcriptional activator TenA
MEDRRTADPDTQPTADFKAIMREAAETRNYTAALSVLVVAEWLYLDWACRALGQGTSGAVGRDTRGAATSG